MSALDSDLEDFLAKVLDGRVLDKARQVCVDQDICSIAILSLVRDRNQLDRVFTIGTALSICNALPGP